MSTFINSFWGGVAITPVGHMTISTTSSSSTWSPLIVSNTGSTLTWVATGAATQTIIADDPIFDFSLNTTNDIINIDVYLVSSLTTLITDGTDITTINLFECTSLEIFQSQNDNITSLDISNNLSLNTLSINLNPLNYISVTNNILLTFINIGYGSNITGLDVSNNTLLTGLLLHNGNNTLADGLDVSNNTLLTSLWVNDSLIPSLDVSNNTLLKQLYFQNTAMTTIPTGISGLTSLERINSFGNSFSSTETNTLLADLVTCSVTNGFLYFTSNETGQGITDRATLVTRGWSITEL